MPENKKKAVCGQQSFVPLSQSFYGFLLEPYLETIRSKRARVEYRRHIHSVCAYFYRIRGSRFSFEQLSEADAKEYFLMYLTGKCNAGELSSDTYKLRLSVCRNFAFFLENASRRLPGSLHGTGRIHILLPFPNSVFPSQNLISIQTIF